MAQKISTRLAKQCALADMKKCSTKGEIIYLSLIEKVKSLPFKQTRENLLTLSTPTIQNY